MNLILPNRIQIGKVCLFVIFIFFKNLLRSTTFVSLRFLKILGFFGLLFSFSNGFGQVVLNEIMADNASGIEDPDFQKKPDWIEIYNGSLSTIDLSGYFLTDDLEEPMKWQIPTGTTILGDQYLLFWADGEDVGNHTNFKLSKSGESIGLFNSTGEMLDSLVYEN